MGDTPKPPEKKIPVSTGNKIENYDGGQTNE